MIYVIDDFYANPDSVREFALQLDFDIVGNYPGLRTQPCSDDGNYIEEIKKTFENILNKEITHFPLDEYNTSFQYTTWRDTTWVHHDAMSYAAVVYLHPNPMLDSGTSMYRHKATGIMKHKEGLPDFNEVSTSLDDWETVTEVKNVYNRAIIYDSMNYHRSTIPGFGVDKESGRLFQTFFFDAKQKIKNNAL